LSAFTTEQESESHPLALGELSLNQTLDGSFSLHSNYFQEGFHDNTGAIAEAKAKFIRPAELNNLKSKKPLRILDVCVGLGYNTACALEETQKMSLDINWWGLEIDQRPLKIALGSKNFRNNWSNKTLKSLEEISKNSSWRNSSSKGEMLWGDARDWIRKLPQNINFHLIMLDPFSPKKCPELWTQEFLRDISIRLAPKGRIVTYCTAAAIRSSLQDSGLGLLSINPLSRDSKRWSNGTIAMHSEEFTQHKQENGNWHQLTQMEREHLLTRAAIKYRDPSGKDSSAQIIQRRKQEQETSKLESTSSWQKRWLKK